MAIIKRKEMCWQDVEKIDHLCTVGTATTENSMEVSQKLKIELLYNPTIQLLSIYPKELKAEFQRDICTLLSIAVAKLWKQPKYPSITR